MGFLILRNLLTSDARAPLEIKERHFQVGEYGDVACLFKVIVDKINPSSRSGTVSVKTKMKNMKLSNFMHVVPDANQRMEHCLEQIMRNGGQNDDIKIKLFFHVANFQKCKV